MKNKKLLSMLCAVLCMAFFLGGCGEKDDGETSVQGSTPVESSEPAETSEPAEDGEVTLAEWEGAWNSIDAYADEEELAATFEEVAEKEGQTKDEAIAAFKEKRKCEFKGIKFEGDKVTFLDGFEDADGKEIDSSEYEYVKTHEAEHDGGQAQWHEFKAKNDDAKYPVLLLMPVHGEEEVIHFHLRYGTDGEELMAKDDWYPTLIKPSTTMDQLKAEVGE